MPTIASLPSIHTTGPVHNFIRLPNGDAYYLGTCEAQPQIKIERAVKDVFNDLGGRLVPFQQLSMGETGVVGLLLTRFSQAAYRAVRDPGASISGETSPTPGQETNFGGRGLFVFGVQSVELVQVFDFYGTDAATPNLPPGRIWWNATVAAHEIADSGTAEEKILLVFRTFGIWDDGSTGEKRGFYHYSEDPEAIPFDREDAQ